MNINHAFAGTLEPITPLLENWMVSLSFGPAWENGEKTHTFFLTEEIERAYVSNKSNTILLNGELFLGWQKILSQYAWGQFGLAISVNSPACLSGVIWEDALPEFDNYVYSYRIQHSHVSLKAKWLPNWDCFLLPWVSTSVGIGFNSAHSYQSTPLLFEALANPNFSPHTQTSFTYTLGTGLQKIMSPHWQLGAGYELSDWGRNHLGRAYSQTVNTGIDLAHFYTHSVLFNVSYIC